MLASIEASNGVGLRRALIGLSIRHASEGTAARLCKAGYATIEQVAEASIDDLQRVDDVGPTVAASIVEFFARPEISQQVARLREYGVNLDVLDDDRPIDVSSDAPLAGETVVVTGAVSDPRSGEKVTRPAFSKLVERAGATVASSVSASSTVLVTGANVGAGKTSKAEALGVRVVDQSEVWRLLIDAGIA
jgi:DNA ligase (NAD+)